MLHSVVLKKVGYLSCGIGIAFMVVMALAFAFLQSFAIAWAYFITVGVYFVVIGIIIWLVGIAKEMREARIEQEECARRIQEMA